MELTKEEMKLVIRCLSDIKLFSDLILSTHFLDLRLSALPAPENITSKSLRSLTEVGGK